MTYHLLIEGDSNIYEFEDLDLAIRCHKECMEDGDWAHLIDEKGIVLVNGHGDRHESTL